MEKHYELVAIGFKKCSNDGKWFQRTMQRLQMAAKLYAMDANGCKMVSLHYAMIQMDANGYKTFWNGCKNGFITLCNDANGCKTFCNGCKNGFITLCNDAYGCKTFCNDF